MNKQEILDYLMGEVQQVKDGNKSALDVYPKLNELKKSIDEIRKEIYDDVISEAEKYDKREDIIREGYRITIQSKEYPQYKEDAEYSFIKEKLNNRKSLIKKATKRGEPLKDSETGEVVEPVNVKYSMFPKCEFVGQQVQ